MFISILTINSFVRRFELGNDLGDNQLPRRKDDLCLFLSLQSTPSYVDWNWASKKDDLFLLFSLQSTPSYVELNWASRKDDLCLFRS